MLRPVGLPTDSSRIAVVAHLPSPYPLGINYHPVDALGLLTPTNVQAAKQVDLRIDRR